jgi:hypothetical protein
LTKRLAWKVGDRVQWTSQAQGCTKTKLGTVVAVIPKGDRPTGIKGCGWHRDHESYVIEVQPKTGSRAKPKAYWPVVSALKGAE